MNGVLNPGKFFSSEDYKLLQSCIHCGLCLPACPTYQVTGHEADSPRGRLELMRYIDEYGAADSEPLYTRLDPCLGCLACETACPSGVQFGHLMEETRSRKPGGYLSTYQRAMLNLLTGKVSLKWLSRLLMIGQRTGLLQLASKLPILPKSLRFQMLGIPKQNGEAFSRTVPELLPACHPEGKVKGTVLLFTGCVMDQWYQDVHAATVRVLRWNGYHVRVPKDQSCCGALHAHSGEGATAFETANERLLHHPGVVTVIVNSAGCGERLKQNDHEGKVKDAVEFLVKDGWIKPEKLLAGRYAYDAPCHLHHGQGVKNEPFQLLKSACADVIPTPDSDTCCGSAGFYSLVQGEMSREVLANKLDALAAESRSKRGVKYDGLITANPGCQIHLTAGLKSRRWKMPVYHTIQLLDMAYSESGLYRNII